jgi:hypothetical protein
MEICFNKTGFGGHRRLDVISSFGHRADEIRCNPKLESFPILQGGQFKRIESRRLSFFAPEPTAKGVRNSWGSA